MFKNLVIAPHVDDEVLGCSSVLGPDTFVYFCGVDETYSYGDSMHRIPLEDRLLEAKEVSEYFGHSFTYISWSRVNTYNLLEIKDALEAMVNEIKPERIFIHEKGFNQDHNTVYDASMIALRPHDKNFFVKKVLVYESVHDVTWPPETPEVSYYIRVDMVKKLMAYSMHASQVRPYRGPDMITALARLRGASAGTDYAEGFKVLRYVE